MSNDMENEKMINIIRCIPNYETANLDSVFQCVSSYTNTKDYPRAIMALNALEKAKEKKVAISSLKDKEILALCENGGGMSLSYPVTLAIAAVAVLLLIWTAKYRK